ncbi:MAG: hypothetical protein IH899_04460 [Planctomycetes bacterium]|nr:hypothetical protein [Planctomycetota bacterium]
MAQLRGITDEPVWDSGTLIRSAPDAIAHALARAIGLEKGGDVESQLALFQKEQLKGGAAQLLPRAARDRAVVKANGNGSGRSDCRRAHQIGVVCKKLSFQALWFADLF